MRLTTLTALALLFVTAGFAAPQQSTPTGGTPASGVTHRPPVDPCSGTQPETVDPDSSSTNGDGVTVDNEKKSRGKASIDPKGGCGDGTSATTVKTKTRFKGEITGLDSNDEVELSASNTATVKGEGGTVTLSGSSHVTVENTGEAGGASITVNLPSGGNAIIGPGSSVTFNT